jgi:nucleoside-diphosphate-sugar epimerase
MNRLWISGALGCIGTLAAKYALSQGMKVVCADLPGASDHRHKFWLDHLERGKITYVQVDVRNQETVYGSILETGATHVLHLAGLQTPQCKANPVMGAQVNIMGTLHVYDAVRKLKGQVRGLALASSVAGAVEAGQRPLTMYGVFKRMGEDMGWRYAEDYGVGSVQLEPYIVTGVGRDDGLTSDVTKAVLAIAAKKPYVIGFDGPFVLQQAPMVGQMFVQAALAEVKDFQVCNVGGDILWVEHYVAFLRRLWPDAQVEWVKGNKLPYPCDAKRSDLIAGATEFPLERFLLETHDRFMKLLATGQIDLKQLEKKAA